MLSIRSILLMGSLTVLIIGCPSPGPSNDAGDVVSPTDVTDATTSDDGTLDAQPSDVIEASVESDTQPSDVIEASVESDASMDGDPGDVPMEPADGSTGDGATATCQSNDDCAETEFCKKADGDCNGMGVCEITPDFCIGFDQVCGCDGMTHSGECQANTQRTSIDFRGECP
jgi:hypothetical protein